MTLGAVTLRIVGSDVPSTLTVTISGGATYGFPASFTLDQDSLLDALYEFADVDGNAANGIQLLSTADWVITLDTSRLISRLGTSDQYVVPIIVEKHPSCVTSTCTPVCTEAAPCTQTVTPTIKQGSVSWSGTPTDTGATKPGDVSSPLDITTGHTYIDVTYSPTLGALIRGSTIDGDEFTLTGPGVVPGLSFGPVIDLGNGVYRYTINGTFRPGAVNVVFALDKFEDDSARAPPAGATDTQQFTVAGTSGDLVRTIPAAGDQPQRVVALSGGTVGRSWINARGYLEVRFTPTSGYAIDPTSVNGDELQLRDSAGHLVALGSPVRQGSSNVWQYSFSSPLAAGGYTLTILAGSVTDTSGTSNQVESEQFTVVTPTSGISNPANNQVGSTADFNSRGWIDVTYAGADPASILDSQAEFTLTSSTGNKITLVGLPVRVSGDKYRYFFTGHYSGDLQFAWIAGSFAPAAGASVITPSVETASAADVLARTWIDLSYQSGAGAVDAATVTGNELGTVAGLTAAGVNQVDGTTFRYLFTGDLAAGTVTVTVLDGSWADLDGNLGGGSVSTFRLVAPAQSFYIEIVRRPAARAAGLRRRAAGRPLRQRHPRDRHRSQALHADLRRPAQADQARHRRRHLRPVRARHGRRHLVHPRLLGRRHPGDELQVAGAVRPVPLGQGHAADQHDERRQDRGADPQGHRRRRRGRHPHLRARSAAASPSSWSARPGCGRRARSSDLVRMQGGFFLSIDASNDAEAPDVRHRRAVVRRSATRSSPTARPPGSV